MFSRATYCWRGWIGRGCPSLRRIDAFASKNQTLEPSTVNAILQAAGILEDPDIKVGAPGSGV